MSDQLARDIELLAELFKTGGWQEVRVESQGISLLLSNDPATAPIGGVSAASVLPAPLPGAGPAAASAATSPTSSVAVDTPSAVDPSWKAVTAPNLGTFYRSPKPGSPAFVEVGRHVEADTEVCLIEVMKLFTSVKAGVAGTVKSIVAADAALVEGGQVLLYIQQD
ncbi:acetyl-CoA carboxylase biotin carboxyl carrier protein [Sphingobium yanoikuyae]|uniref:acetyl-CoA carboxylase biotin carboxyl carrier protein n=1 Tax=Sphingobium yanoikuyae TaxID=13690 RepID=UPI0005610870|nr:biotin/lipoyl-containing protein [Sphingobium yanoikuyae]